MQIAGPSSPGTTGAKGHDITGAMEGSDQAGEGEIVPESNFEAAIIKPFPVLKGSAANEV